MVKVYIGLGSNMGDREGHIETALQHLKAEKEIRLLRVASLYFTEPVGFAEQEWFVNTVAEMETSLAPYDLMSRLLMIENRMGRKRNVYWGPRVIDLDILLYGDLRLAIPGLQIPHPRMTTRAFVLVPLAELDPGLLLEGRRVDSLAREFAAVQKVERWVPVANTAQRGS